MANRTISLDDTADKIREKLVRSGQNFSHWVRLQLIKWEVESTGMEMVKPRRFVPPEYTCTKCKRMGDHWSNECPWYKDVEE